eukprot:3958985-Prymnesium_polylepis.1
MNKLEDKLKRLQIQYWKENGRRVGYQSGTNPLPPSAREREESSLRHGHRAEREAAMHMEDAGMSYFDSDSVGGRKRRLPSHMSDYQVYRRRQPAAQADPGAARARAAGSSVMH